MAEPFIVRAGGSRAVISLASKLVIALVLIIVMPLVAFWPFGRTHAPEVTIHDEADIVQDEATARDLSTLRFREDIHLAVVTLDVGYNDNFNAAVLEYARAHEPGWLDGNYWADGMLILAVSPRGRWVGCYFGENVKVDLAVQQNIQDAAKSSFQASSWDLGIQQMAARAATVMGRPIGSELDALLVSGLGMGGGLILLGWMLWARSRARTFFGQARRHYTQVTNDYEGTELKAGLIPLSDAHGAQVLARFAWFEDRYGELTRNFHEFGEPRGAQWFETGRRSKAKKLLDLAGELDSLLTASR